MWTGAGGWGGTRERARMARCGRVVAHEHANAQDDVVHEHATAKDAQCISNYQRFIHASVCVFVCLPKFKLPQGTVSKHHNLLPNTLPRRSARGQNNKHCTAHREGRREREREGENASLRHPLACISIHTGILMVSFDLAFPTLSPTTRIKGLSRTDLKNSNF